VTGAKRVPALTTTTSFETSLSRSSGPHQRADLDQVDSFADRQRARGGHHAAPVFRFNANTLFPVVTATSGPTPPGPFCHTAATQPSRPWKVVKSRRRDHSGRDVFVSPGWMKCPSRDGLLLRSVTDWLGSWVDRPCRQSRPPRTTNVSRFVDETDRHAAPPAGSAMLLNCGRGFVLSNLPLRHQAVSPEVGPVARDGVLVHSGDRLRQQPITDEPGHGR
jgi:hypothetical protein